MYIIHWNKDAAGVWKGKKFSPDASSPRSKSACVCAVCKRNCRNCKVGETREWDRYSSPWDMIVCVSVCDNRRSRKLLCIPRRTYMRRRNWMNPYLCCSAACFGCGECKRLYRRSLSGVMLLSLSLPSALSLSLSSGFSLPRSDGGGKVGRVYMVCALEHRPSSLMAFRVYIYRGMYSATLRRPLCEKSCLRYGNVLCDLHGLCGYFVVLWIYVFV